MLSRFWYFLVAALGGAGLFAAFAAQQQINQDYETQVHEALNRDRVELELWLRYDARARLDAIAPVAANGDIRSKLREASGRRNRDELSTELSASLGQALQNLNNQLRESAATLLFAVDNGGEIIGQLGGTAPPQGAALGAFPVVRRALSGYASDDVWIYNDNIYRVAARPVIDRGRYVGAVIHCTPFDENLARRLGARLGGASLGFFHRDHLLTSHAASVTGAPGATQLEGQLAETVAALPEDGRSEAIALSERASGVYSLVTGSARHDQVGYVIGRPQRFLASPMELFTQEAFDAVNWPLVAGLPLLLALLGLFFVFLERDRPLKAFHNAVGALGKGELQRLDETSLSGRFRDLAIAINEGIDRAAAAGGSTPAKAADLDAILGENKAESPSFFGLGSTKDTPDTEDLFAPPPAKPAAPKPPKPAAPKPPIPQATPKPPMAPPKAPPMAPPAAPPAAPPKAPPAMPAAAPSVPKAASDEFEDEGATMVAQVPAELIEEAARQNEEQDHFHEVYEKFVALKQECGEDTSSLTFSKLEKTLKKNRDAIVAKHGAKGVRFTVYKKNGKAALKATPVKG